MVVFKYLTLMLVFTSWGLELDVKTKLSAKSVEMGDRVVLSIEITSNEKQISIDDKTQNPRVEGLDFLNRSVSTATSMSFVSGQRSISYTQTLNFFFTPTRLGRIKIPRIPVLIQGKPYYSKATILQVVKELTRKQKQAKRRKSLSPFGNNMDSIFNQFFGSSKNTTPETPEFFVDVEVEKQNPYESEQFLAKWYIYTNGALSQFDTLKFPTLKGFWKEDVEFAQNFRWERAEKDGKTYRRALMSSYALTPYKAGTLYIDSFDIRATVSSTRFGFGKPKVFKVKSREYEIAVQELPEPRPELFSGGVGNFSAELDVFPERVVSGEAFPVSIRIKGNESNAKFLKVVGLDLGSDFELYEKKENVKFFPNQASYIKKVEYLLLPKKVGRYSVPDLKIIYFDPLNKEYVPIYLQFPVLNVLKNTNALPVGDVLLTNEKEALSKEIEIQFLDQTPFIVKLISPSYALLTLPVWFFVLLSFGAVLYLFIKRPENVTFAEVLEKEVKVLEAQISSKEYKEALEKMINLLSFGVGALSGRRYGVERTLNQSLDLLPVSLKQYKPELIELNQKLQAVRFGRATAQDKIEVENCYSKFLEFKKMVINYLERE